MILVSWFLSSKNVYGSSEVDWTKRLIKGKDSPTQILKSAPNNSWGRQPLILSKLQVNENINLEKKLGFRLYDLMISSYQG